MQVSNYYKSVLKTSKLFMLFKLFIFKSLLTVRKLAFMTFCKLVIVFSTKINLLFLCYIMVERSFLLCLIKQVCWNLFYNSYHDEM